MRTDDPIHPSHYKKSETGYECIDFMELMNCPNLATAFKYVWRYEYKGKPLEDLGKALYYVEREESLRNRWTRPLRFDTASGQPIGHLPEDDLLFGDFYEKSERGTALSTLTALWYADMTSGDSTLTLAKEFLKNLIEETEDA